jgi:hypothetical protein
VALLANREKSAGGNPSPAYSRAFGVPIFAEALSARCLPAAARGFTNPASAMASGLSLLGWNSKRRKYFAAFLPKHPGFLGFASVKPVLFP